MKHNVRIWTWKPLVPGSVIWQKGVFVLGTDPLPKVYFTVNRMENLISGWIRMGVWAQDCEAMNSSDFRFYSTKSVRVYDLLRRISWK